MATQNARRHGSGRTVWRAMLCVLLALSMVALVACGDNKQGEAVTDSLAGGGFDADGLDTRASAADTFGSSVQNLEDGGEQLTSTAPLEQVKEVYDLGLFTGSFLVDKGLFAHDLEAALGSAGVPDGATLPLDVLDRVDSFGILSAFDEGAEAMCAYWQKEHPGDPWTYEYETDQGYFDLLLYADGVAAAQFFGYWDKPGQYLWCQYNTVGATFEIDAVRTAFGWALQTYDSPDESVHRITFCETGSPNGGIGLIQGVSGQPRALESTEPIDLPTQWTDLSNDPEPTWILVDGDTLKIRDAARIRAGAATGVEAYPLSNSNNSNTTTGTLSTDPTSYARVWHGSPVLGSGWSERFVLYDDGTFIWGANEMDGASRMRYLAGSWDVSDGLLTLDCYFVVVWEGGREVQNNGQYGSYGSSTVLLDPITSVYSIEDTIEMPVSAIAHDGERDLDTATFNSLQCWDYSSQADGAVAGFWEALEKAEQSSTNTSQKAVSGPSL